MSALLIVLAVIGAVVALGLLVVLLAVLLGMRKLRRRNRVSPGEPSNAPLTWLGSPTAPARLHRRLRSAVSVAQLIVTRHAGDRAPDATAHMAAEVERQAVAIDHQLAVAAGMASADRRRMVGALNAQVVQVEQLVSRLQMLDLHAAAPLGRPDQPSALDDLAQRLDHLEAARREVDEVDAHVGLGRPPAMPAPLPPSAAPAPSRPAGSGPGPTEGPARQRG